MKLIDQIGAQGDVLFVRVSELPSGLQKDQTEEPIVAHSETGHHHVARKRDGYVVERFIKDEMTAYLRIRKHQELVEQADNAMASIDDALASVGATVEHLRDYDTHETFGLACEGEEAIYEVRRQEELRPGGWARIED